jgi:hypothetical protein
VGGNEADLHCINPVNLVYVGSAKGVYTMKHWVVLGTESNEQGIGIGQRYNTVFIQLETITRASRAFLPASSH